MQPEYHTAGLVAQRHNVPCTLKLSDPHVVLVFRKKIRHTLDPDVDFRRIGVHKTGGLGDDFTIGQRPGGAHKLIDNTPFVTLELFENFHLTGFPDPFRSCIQIVQQSKYAMSWRIHDSNTDKGQKIGCRDRTGVDLQPVVLLTKRTRGILDFFKKGHKRII